MPRWPDILELLSAEGIIATTSTEPEPLRGGDISAAWQLQSASGAVFLKTGPATVLPHFSAESDALAEISATNTVRVPAPLCVTSTANTAVLALEWLDLQPPSERTASMFGKQLAALHQSRSSSFGWHRDNVIGSTPQPNPASSDWPAFYREYRLQHQLQLAAANGYGGELQEEGSWLCENLGALFSDHHPHPSLLHGDLWGGNWAASGGQPVTFDPASYYGDRETDLAMTRLFGGFSSEFYSAYNDAWPLPRGADARLPLYQLYHVLNHLNLFGGGYESQALRLLAVLRRNI